MKDWFISLSSHFQSLIISASTSLFICIFPLLFTIFREKYILRYKLKKEYLFNQRIGIKECLASSRTPLIKASEELNYRLWNLSNNIDKKWHSRTNAEIKTLGKCYYLKSLVYRLLVFLYWIDKAEKDIYNFDFSIAEKEEKSYLKYIKVLKHFFCESDLLKDIGYDCSRDDAHFYKDNINIYINYIQEDSSIISYRDFELKMVKDYSQIDSVVNYIAGIESSDNNFQYNIFKSFHLFLILFLNKYGLDYHYTDRNKFKNLISEKYSSISIKPALLRYFKRNKATKEAMWIIKYLHLEPQFSINFVKRICKHNR